MRIIPFAFIGLLLSVDVVRAQPWEAGMTVAAACKGSDGSLCDSAEGRQPLVGGYVSWLPSDRFELGAQVARFGLSPYHVGPRVPPLDFEVTDRSRLFVSFLATYRFLPGRPVQPMVGIGSGWFREAATVTCQPAGCESVVPPGLTYGDRADWLVDAIIVLGVSGDLPGRWTWRAGWQAHRFANDENSTTQFFAGAGLRFGGR
jgi:hypothetical protein